MISSKAEHQADPPVVHSDSVAEQAAGIKPPQVQVGSGCIELHDSVSAVLSALSRKAASCLML